MSERRFEERSFETLETCSKNKVFNSALTPNNHPKGVFKENKKLGAFNALNGYIFVKKLSAVER
jgi:hypothetical protein